MLDRSASSQAIKRLFTRVRVADIDRLFHTLETRSRMSVFRRMREAGYLSSYTHTGRWYTLAGIPVFDDQGLWFHQGVGFSSWGALTDTIVHFIEESEAGKTQRELADLLRVRVQNALLGLVRRERIGRRPLDESFLYVSVDEVRARSQLDSRIELRRRDRLVQPPDPGLVIEVLSEVIRAAGMRIAAPSAVVDRLSARGIEAGLEQVEAAYREYGLEPGKKTADSRRSRT